MITLHLVILQQHDTGCCTGAVDSAIKKNAASEKAALGIVFAKRKSVAGILLAKLIAPGKQKWRLSRTAKLCRKGTLYAET